MPVRISPTPTALPAWDSTVTLNGAANLGGTATLTLNGVVSGASGALTKTGAGTLNLNGTAANTTAASTTVSAGTLALGKSTGVNAVSGDITIGAGGVSLQVDDQIPNASTGHPHHRHLQVQYQQQGPKPSPIWTCRTRATPRLRAC